MNEEQIDVSNIPACPLKPKDYESYDKSYYFSDPDSRSVFDNRVIKNPGNLLDLHDFMPWGWTLDFPILRDFNVSAGIIYGGETSFYSMRGIKFKPSNNKENILEQLADKWLEIYVSKKGPKKFILTGASLGALFATIIASKAKTYNLEVPHLYLNEPAGVSPKNITRARKQMVNDTKFELDYSSKALGKRYLKINIIKYAIGNISNERKVVNELLKGTLSAYVNKYLHDTNGTVHFIHGANSSFITSSDITMFHSKIVQKGKIKYIHVDELKHGVGPDFIKLATWFIEYISETQANRSK